MFMIERIEMIGRDGTKQSEEKKCEKKDGRMAEKSAGLTQSVTFKRELSSGGHFRTRHVQ
jgi:hypothetical protein